MSITKLPRYRRDGTRPKPAAPPRPPRVIHVKCSGATLPMTEACGMCVTCRRRLYMRQWRKIQRRKHADASRNAAIRFVYLLDVQCRRLAPIQRAAAM